MAHLGYSRKTRYWTEGDMESKEDFLNEKWESILYADENDGVKRKKTEAA